MRFRHLRRTLHGIVLAGLPALALAACDAEPGHSTAVVHIATPASPQLQAMINACAAGATDVCLSLCSTFLCNEKDRIGVLSCELSRDGTDAVLTIGYDDTAGTCGVEGRKPAGLRVPRPVEGAGAIGAWLARAAHLEAASVHAFVALARELLAHGAPASLARAALAAAQDEVVHATLTAALAARHGATPPPVHVEPAAVRPIEAIAIENAIEGCVRETWGAMLAFHQSRAARDPEVRAVMARIAEDELRHAALGWAVDRWAGAHLDEAARRRVATVRLAAAAELVAQSATGAARDPELVERLGLPDAAQAQRLLGEAHAAVWS